MKKKLEAELISIAHRILKLKNKSDLIQLHQETQKLYEKLSVLRFVEENFADVKPTIGLAEIEEKIESAFESDEVDIITAVETKTEETIQEVDTEKETVVENVEEEITFETSDLKEATISEEVAEEPELVAVEEKEIEEETSFKPAFELSFDSKVEEDEITKSTSTQITFDDLLGSDYVDPVFVKPEDLVIENEVNVPSNVIPIGRSYNDSAPVISMNNDFNSISINDRISKGIIIGLNDRIAFMNHLFANSSEDYNRVLSQLMTFDTYQEAEDFIENMVKPDYNNWEGKDEYAERFMNIVEKKFS